jgi:hypothetical protein
MPNVLSWYHAIMTHVNMQELFSRATVSEILTGENHMSTSIHTVKPQFFNHPMTWIALFFVCFIYEEWQNCIT